MSAKIKTASLGIVATFGVALFTTVPAYSAGDSSSVVTPTCKRGFVWSNRRKKCVETSKLKKADKSNKDKKAAKKKRKWWFQRDSYLDDDNIYQAARDLAYNRRYDEAIDVLRLAENQNDPRILNYLGYSTRKLGRVEEGLSYYRAALKADPDYTLVREYMGEAFLMLGKVHKAREQLTEIEKRCGIGCREYVMLKDQIDKYAVQ